MCLTISVLVSLSRAALPDEAHGPGAALLHALPGGAGEEDQLVRRQVSPDASNLSSSALGSILKMGLDPVRGGSWLEHCTEHFFRSIV